MGLRLVIQSTKMHIMHKMHIITFTIIFYLGRASDFFQDWWAMEQKMVGHFLK